MHQFAAPELRARIETVAGGETPEALEWGRLLGTARGLAEWAGYVARRASLEVGSFLPNDDLVPEHARPIDDLRAGLGRPPPAQPGRPYVVPAAFAGARRAASGASDGVGRRARTGAGRS